MRNHVIGIDPSLTATAVAAISREPCLLAKMNVFSSAPPSRPGVLWRVDRYYNLARRISDTAREYPAEAILIEGYSSVMKGNAATTLCEFGGILRYLICQWLPPETTLFEVPPQTLKLFTIGVGKGDKTAMALAAYKRWGAEFGTDDEVDAYCLARMAACIAGFEQPANDAQRRAIDTVVNGKAKKKKSSLKALQKGTP